MSKPAFYAQLKHKAEQIKQELKALYIASRDGLVPWYVNVLIVITIGYAVSPIDLIPDFIPILGLLDELIILPLFVSMIVLLIPEHIMQQCREKAVHLEISKKHAWIGTLIIVTIWIALILWLAYPYIIC